MALHVDTFAAATEPTLQLLERFYAIRGPEEIAEFFDTHPLFAPLLIEARSELEKHFGSKSTVALQVAHDPEWRGLVNLFGYIITSLNPEEAGKRLRQFDREWFLKQDNAVLEILNFDLEYV